MDTEEVSKTRRIRDLNDIFRATFIGGRVILTPGIMSCCDHGHEPEVLDKVRHFKNFEEDNDPYGEHDFGAIDHNGKKIFWKIDYYNKTMDQGSEDPSDPTITTRVLTIMLAEEY